ncbi:MAG TPA: hypothetical protein VK667_02605 [Ktedonobacteraceae bacterium]|nr:hypothetical protein [Ktedonobacteraceae bacterium]
MPGRFGLKELLANRNNPNKILTPLVDQFLLTNSLTDFTEEEIALATRLMTLWTKERDHDFHSPSSASACLRQQMLTYLDYKGSEVDDPYLKNIFDDGNWRHLRWHMIFVRMQRAGLLKVVKIEEKIKYQPWFLSGTPDDVLDIPSAEGIVRVVVDVKGAHDEKFNTIVSTGQPVDGHEWQLHGYMVGLRLGRGILFYENKNTQRYHELAVKRDPEIVRELRRRYKVLKQSRETNILPSHGCSMQAGDIVKKRCRQRLNCIRLTADGQ